LCPMGAIAGVFNKVSILNIRLDEEKCIECSACIHACPMGLTETEDIGNSTDCILCGRCVEACPERALSFGIEK
jgi:ferredoxin-type protein NapH